VVGGDDDGRWQQFRASSERASGGGAARLVPTKRAREMAEQAAAEAPAAPAAEARPLEQLSVEELRERVRALELAAGPAEGEQPKKSKGKKGKYLPKTPLGMRDYHPEEMAVREQVFDIIKSVFKRHGAVSIETPVAELKETLTGKYGEDSKLIYDLADQGGEILALRYDLTVPFARFCAEHGIDNIKRYHIARVYRRDNPVMSKGRYREFYQCDIDIAGDFEAMVPDAECVKIATEVLGELNIGDFCVKMNHRKLLDGIFKVAGVPEDLLRPICSAVDKLDKLEWAEVRKEMLDKGINGDQADKIWTYVQRKGGRELVEDLLKDEDLTGNEIAKEGLDAMLKLFTYLEAYNVPGDRVSFDLSLARGLDYYTGVIYEVVLQGEEVGSVAGGGRYDELVGMFLASKKKSRKIPCVGISFGIERLFTVVARRRAAESASVSSRPTQVLVAGVASKEEKYEILEARMKLCAELWAADVRAETAYKVNAKFMTQIQQCEKEVIPLCICIGRSELDEGIVKINVIPSPEAREAGASREEIIVPRAEFVAKVQELLAGQSN